MQQKRLEIGYRIILGILLASAICLPVSAVGIGIGPSTVTFSDAIRGGEYERTISIFNSGTEEFDATFSTVGEAAEWISIHERAADSPMIETVTVPAKNSTYVTMMITVPEETAKGVYNATLYAETTSSNDQSAEAGVGTAFRGICTVTIEVTGIETLDGMVDGIFIQDTEEDLPLKVEVYFQNTGNVIARPLIQCRINESGSGPRIFEADDTEVRPGMSKIIVATWNDTGLEKGRYTAEVSVSLGKKTIAEKDVIFTLYPTGTLSRLGELTELRSDGDLSLERPLKIIGIFRNTGDIETKAKLVGEVYREGVLVDTISSEEVLVPLYTEEDLISYLTIHEPGEYVIKAYALYGGKKTNMSDLSLSTPGADAPLSALPAVSALLITGLVLAWRRRGV